MRGRTRVGLRGLAALVGVLAAMALGPRSAEASPVFTFTLSYEFSGGSSPSGPAPWLTASFENVGQNEVLLTMTSNLTGSEFVGKQGWSFNLDPALNPSNLTFTYMSGSTASVQTGTNLFKADGDGYFDIMFQFPTSSSNPGARFGVGDTSTYLISGTSLQASSFFFFSAPGGGNGQYVTAAHVQGIGTNGGLSGWIADPIPEPASLVLFGTGLALVARQLRKRTKA